MALADLISSEVVKVPLQSKNKTDVIKELIEVLKDSGRIKEIEAAYNAVIARENLSSTGLEEGIAVPHAKTTAVQTLAMALGIAPGGVDFNALDGKPSYIFFLMLAPPDQPGPHIEALSEIARITKSKAFCNLLINAKSSAEVVELFREE
ncbi:MAG: PTS sugar transporter subunit IIA [Spirochaetota bacterium]